MNTPRRTERKKRSPLLSEISRRQKVIEIARRKGVIRPLDLEECEIPRTYLQRMVQDGTLERLSRGLYRLTEAIPGEHATLTAVAKRVPNGVVCLLSALRFHDLGTQLPSRVWMAIGQKQWQPRIADLPVRFVTFSGSALTEGVETHNVYGIPVKVYTPAKTVADCFKYRNKIGLDVAIEALRDCTRRKDCPMDELWRFAKICRVTNVIRPYLEAIG